LYSEVFNTGKGQHVWKDETICELHRQIYDLIFVNLCVTNPKLLDRITPVLEKAYLCGVKMTKKLVEHKLSLPEWEEHASKEEVQRLRQLRIELAETLEKNQ
jgi:hypothetical protein